jgi:hypothetical protein
LVAVFSRVHGFSFDACCEARLDFRGAFCFAGSMQLETLDDWRRNGHRWWKHCDQYKRSVEINVAAVIERLGSDCSMADYRARVTRKGCGVGLILSKKEIGFFLCVRVPTAATKRTDKEHL